MLIISASMIEISKNGATTQNPIPFKGHSLHYEEIIILEKRIAKVLGLNKHFPLAGLFGPVKPGEIGIETMQVIITIIWVNCFLSHTSKQTNVGIKLEKSMAYLQLEVRLSSQAFTMPFLVYGHPATHVLLKYIWGQTESYGLTVQVHTDSVWTP
jgi:hypothetical protein